MKLAIIFQSRDESRIVIGGIPLNVSDRQEREARRRQAFRDLTAGALLVFACWLIVSNALDIAMGLMK